MLNFCTSEFKLHGQTHCIFVVIKWQVCLLLFLVVVDKECWCKLVHGLGEIGLYCCSWRSMAVAWQRTHIIIPEKVRTQ